jgi:hypothetical protein
MCGESFDLALGSLDHRLQIDDELLVNRVSAARKSIEGGSAGSIENPEHREMFVGISVHLRAGDARRSLS